MAAEKPDELDVLLISLLQERGRTATSEIARIVEVPESTVRRRIDRLQNDGIITVVAVVQAPELFGLPVHASLFFGVAPSDQKGVVDQLVACDEIRWIALTTGPLSIASEGYFRSNEHLREFIELKISLIQGIQEYRVDLILDLFKNRFDWAGMSGASGRNRSRYVRGRNGKERSGS